MSAHDADTFPAENFANWLFGEVDGALDPDMPASVHHVTAADLRSLFTAGVLALAFDACQPALTRVAALEALRERYEAAEAARYSPERCAQLEAIMGDVIEKFNALGIRPTTPAK